MAADLSEQRAVLERELARLEQLLQADANWRALQAAEQRPVVVLDEHDASREEEIGRLLSGLRKNRIFCARERILEALALVRREEERSSRHDEQVSSNDTQRSPVAVPKPTAGRSLVETTKAERPKALEAREGGTTVKAKIRSEPPEPRAPSAQAQNRPADDLTAIRGITRTRATSLADMGIRHFEQIAAWTPNDVRTISAAFNLGKDISRLNWIEQAAVLAQRAASTAEQAQAPGAAPAAPRPTEEIAVRHEARKDHEGVSATATPKVAKTERRETNGVEPRVNAIAETSEGNSAEAQPTASNKAPPVSQEAAAAPIVTNIPRLVSNAASSVLFNSAFKPTTESSPDWLAKAAAQRILTRAQRGEACPAHHPIKSERSPPSNDNTQPGASALAVDLRLIRNIDADLAHQLRQEGVTDYAQIADFGPKDIARIRAALNLGNRISTEGWIEQASILARGEKTAFAKQVAAKLSQQPSASASPVLPPPLPASHRTGVTRGNGGPIRNWDVLTKQPLDVAIEGIDTLPPAPLEADYNEAHTHAPEGFGVGLRRFDSEADVAIVAVSKQEKAINGRPDPMGSHDGGGRKSLAARLRRANNRAQPVDARQYAGYRSEVAEASVEIVRYKRPDGAVAHVPTEHSAGNQIGDGRTPLIEPEEKRPWFKALIGR